MNTATRLLIVAALALVAAGCGNKTCEAYCDRNTVCASQKCTLKDPESATSACVSACTASFGYMDDATADAVTACMDCLTVSPACNESPSKCKATCEGDAVEKGGKILDTQFEALGENESAACTNGQNPFGGDSCSGGSGGDGASETCDFACENGSAEVAVQCSGPTGSITCICTQGKKKGKSFSVQSCDKLFDQSIWDRCNL